MDEKELKKMMVELMGKPDFGQRSLKKSPLGMTLKQVGIRNGFTAIKIRSNISTLLKEANKIDLVNENNINEMFDLFLKDQLIQYQRGHINTLTSYSAHAIVYEIKHVKRMQNTVKSVQSYNPITHKQKNFCPNCGIKLENNPNFCTNCGFKL